MIANAGRNTVNSSNKFWARARSGAKPYRILGSGQVPQVDPADGLLPGPITLIGGLRRLHIAMNDGSDDEIGPGEVTPIYDEVGNLTGWRWITLRGS